MGAECVVEHCVRPQRRRDYCGAHYARLLRHGDPLGGDVDRAAANQPCTADGCDQTARAHGRCNAHDKAHRLATDPEYAAQKRAAWREWAARNAESLAATKAAWHAANAQERARLLADWKAANPWHASAYSYTKRRRAYGLPAEIAELVDPNIVYERDGGLCQICAEPVDRTLPFPHPQSLTLDHIVPVSDLASQHTYENTQLSHWDCNRRRQTRPMDSLDWEAKWFQRVFAHAADLLDDHSATHHARG